MSTGPGPRLGRPKIHAAPKSRVDPEETALCFGTHHDRGQPAFIRIIHTLKARLLLGHGAEPKGNATRVALRRH